MAFTPRTFPEILDDMINYVRKNTELTDFEIGSVVRTVLEAAAIEDDEQYFQMVQLLDAFSLTTATGADLDERAAEYDLVRLQPQSATGAIIINEGNLVTEFLAFDTVATAVSLQLDDSSKFPTSGFPYTVRVGEGTVTVEDLAVSANAANVLTVAAAANSHSIGDRVSLVTGVSDIDIVAGAQVQTVATGVAAAIKFTSTETGTIVNGNYASTPMDIIAAIPGSAGVVGTNKIVRFTSSPPFDGALVTNINVTSGGRELELDSEFRDRLRAHIQSLSVGTPLALKEAALGVTDVVSGKRVTTASVVEDFINDEVIIYIDDGTGFVPDQTQLATSSVAATFAVAPSDAIVRVTDADDLPDEGFVVISPENLGAQFELLEFDSITRTTSPATMNLVGTAANVHDALDELVLVEIITSSSEAAIDKYTLIKSPQVRSSERLWVAPSVGDYVLQVEGTDYEINRGLGQIEFVTAPTTGSIILMTYAFYTGLVSGVQRVINGDTDDEINFPGTRAAGIKALVETPTIRRITIRLAISAASGYNEDDIAPLVQEVVEVYVSSRKIGEDIILAEVTERAMGVVGMFNLIIQQPLVDVAVSANELPIPFNTAGTSLITVL